MKYFPSLGVHHDKGIQGINRDIAARLVDILKPHGQIYITSERALEPSRSARRSHRPIPPESLKRLLPPLSPEDIASLASSGGPSGINPLDMHHVMAYASLYIGDSQTMAAEARVLGTPFVRFNDFVGRIGYLDELEAPLIEEKIENKSKIEKKTSLSLQKQHSYRAPYLESITHHYDLGVGIKASEPGSVDRLCQTVEHMVSMPAEERAKIYGQRRQKMLEDKIDYAKFLTWFIEEYPSSAEAVPPVSSGGHSGFIENYPTSVAETKEAGDSFWNQFK